MVWYNNSLVGFLKILNYVPKEREEILQKMSPHLSLLNVAMPHTNYFRRNNLQILKLATYTKIEDHYSRCKLATFWIGKDCQMFIFYFVYLKHQVLLICNEKIKIMLPIWWYNRGSFPLGNKYFGVFVLNGLVWVEVGQSIAGAFSLYAHIELPCLQASAKEHIALSHCKILVFCPKSFNWRELLIVI